MTARTLPALPTPAGPDQHPAWCRRGHYCAAGEHRAEPATISRPGTGSVVLTRVSTGRREHAEVRMSVALAQGDFNARAHLLLILGALEDLLEAVDINP